jgi:hypothetical protein
MKRFSKKVLTLLLAGVPLFSTSQSFAADDVTNVAEALAKIYKLDSLANEFLFGSFAATDAEPTASTKFTNNGKKSSSSGFKIKSMKKLHYKMDQNQFLDLENDGLHYVFKFQF